MTNQEGIFVGMHLLDAWILPLETGSLFRLLVSINLNGLEYLRSKLGLECTQRTLLFKLSNDNVLELVHLLNISSKLIFLII